MNTLGSHDQDVFSNYMEQLTFEQMAVLARVKIFGWWLYATSRG